MSYITVPIDTDPTALSTATLQSLMSSIPGYVPHEGNLEVWLIEILARMEAETRDVATRVPPAIFRYFGQTMMNIAPVDVAPARALSTWTMIDTKGYTIPANTIVIYGAGSSTQAYFQTARAVVVPAGQSSTATGEVELVSAAVGSAANGISPSQFGLVDALAFVTSITTTTTTSGGVNAETDSEYQSRLNQELKLLSPRPILPNDFAVLAKRIAGVDRAVAIDGYNPSNGTYNNERTLTVALADAGGNAVTPDVKAEVAAYLDGLREVNFVVKVIDPTYTTVDVTTTVRRLAGYDSVAVQTSVATALRNYLSPVNWSWQNVVRYNELVTLISNIPGVDYVESISKPTADVILTGVASLTQAGAISVTVL